jgi:NAD(P)H-dependent FMN reductase
MVRIAVVAGSVRSGSFNVMLARAAIRHLEAHGASVTWIDLATFDLPLYAAAIEAERFPPDALRLKQLLAGQHGVLFTSPEYNGSVSPLLKNAIDWASRPTDGEGLVALTAYRGKAAAIMSASLSPFGGLRGLMQLRQILTTIQMLVIPDQLAVPNAHQAFDEDGRLKDPLQSALLESTAVRLVKVSAALSG